MDTKSAQCDGIYSLPTASQEQNRVIELLETANVLVDSVAGSGKTTCILHTAKHFATQKILVLTYNKRLKTETRERVLQMNQDNIEIHNYHSFCVKYYDRECFTDVQIMKVLESASTRILREFSYDMIVIDEVQDMIPLYYRLVCKIYTDNVRRISGPDQSQSSRSGPTLCILGDWQQSIYGYNGADARFITMAPQLFNFNSRPWERCTLSQSFRLTRQMAAFINGCLLENLPRIQSAKIGAGRPNYVICDCFNSSRTLKEVEKYLSMGYSAGDIFVLAPSIRSASSPARCLENKIKTLMPGIAVFVPVSDEERLDSDVIQGKMTFSTFHQAKGLERKVVLVFCFDDSYFRFYNKSANPKVCPNEIYVAVTRAVEHLTVFHHYENRHLPFLTTARLPELCNVERARLLHFRSKSGTDNLDTEVTDLIRHVPQAVLDRCMTYFQVETVRHARSKIDIPYKTDQKFGSESVCEITGTAIPLYFEYKLAGRGETKKVSCLEQIITELKEKSHSKEAHNPSGGWMGAAGNSSSCTAKTEPPPEGKYDINKIDIKNLTAGQLLYVTNVWCAQKSGYMFKLQQIDSYKWLSKENLKLCTDRLRELGISTSAEFEKELAAENRTELFNRRIIGYIDCIDGTNVYEFKCVDQLTGEHCVQLAIYAYLNETRSQSLSSSKLTANSNKYTYYLYNVITGELKKVISDPESLRSMMEYLIVSKYFSAGKMTDDAFLTMMHGLDLGLGLV